MYDVRQAETDDLEKIAFLIEEARVLLKSRNIPQWEKPDGPTIKMFRQDIERREAFVLVESGYVIGVSTIETDWQPDYDIVKNGDWRINEKEYASIHRFMISPSVKVKGMGNLFLRELVRLAQESGYQDIRIDTHPKNRVMEKVIVKSGFERIGDIILPIKNGERIAFQYMKK